MSAAAIAISPANSAFWKSFNDEIFSRFFLRAAANVLFLTSISRFAVACGVAWEPALKAKATCAKKPYRFGLNRVLFLARRVSFSAAAQSSDGLFFQRAHVGNESFDFVVGAVCRQRPSLSFCRSA